MSDWQSVRALLGGIPALPGARCKGRSDLYERTIREYRVDRQTTSDELENARSEALQLCNNGCPALDQCRQFVQGLPIAQRPPGVIAGQVITTSGRTLSTRTTDRRDEAGR